MIAVIGGMDFMPAMSSLDRQLFRAIDSLPILRGRALPVDLEDFYG
jgi:hypothetical protein